MIAVSTQIHYLSKRTDASAHGHYGTPEHVEESMFYCVAIYFPRNYV